MTDAEKTRTIKSIVLTFFGLIIGLLVSTFVYGGFGYITAPGPDGALARFVIALGAIIGGFMAHAGKWGRYL